MILRSPQIQQRTMIHFFSINYLSAKWKLEGTINEERQKLEQRGEMELINIKLHN